MSKRTQPYGYEQEGTFIDPFTDTGFKIIFGIEGKSEEFLISFLNSLFEGYGDFDPITHVAYLDKEQVRENREGRSLVYDINCETSTGHRFIVEMQQSSEPQFIRRSIMYASRAIVAQSHRGDGAGAWNFLPVVSVSLCNFRLEELGDELVDNAELVFRKRGTILPGSPRMVYVQLPVFNKSKEECVTNFDRWIYVLKNMKMMKTMTFEMEQDGVFARLAKVTSVAALSPEEQHQYYRDLKYKNDYIAGLEYQWNTGLQQGRKEAREKTKWEIAQTMKKKGLDLAIISEITGLSISELEKGLK